ncbi:hypothetical protein MVEN_00754500 [Mycena venus]|uniref:F-box domain-containing protein n=1 Tax=Mycena venus TaxID=2733690 RepID=A0A8H6YFJ9_9AGAR|nr:hypothetical protein MVEN_00754500 [Mycena venus]
MESPFIHLFNTNYVPSDKEIEFIQADLVSRSEELTRIEERILELSAQRNKIQAYIDSHRALISHPRRLPSDIVREIFVACLPTDRNAVMTAQEAPMLLCRICSAWRTIALSTARLWASLHVPFGYILGNLPRTQAVIEWLQRSAACPISLSVTYLGPWGGESSTEASALLKTLADLSTRWRCVEFTHLCTEIVRELAEIGAPALESLKFTGNLSLLRGLDIFKLPSLRAVALHSQAQDAVQFDEFVLEMPLVWDQLTHLTLRCDAGHRGFSFNKVIVILEQCTHLVSFQATLWETRTEFDSFSGSMLLPFLESLVLTAGSLTPHSLTHLIEHVSMPLLRRFQVAGLPVGGSDPVSLIPLGAGSPLLRDLGNVHLPFLTAGSIRDTFCSLSSLTRLVVSDRSLDYWDGWDTYNTGENTSGLHSFHTTHLLDLLTPVQDLQAAFCPLLQELVVNYCSGLEKSTLDAFIQGRIESAQGFRRLEFQNPGDPKIVSEAQSQSYLSQGVDISIVYNDPWATPFKPDSPWTGLLQENQ